MDRAPRRSYAVEFSQSRVSLEDDYPSCRLRAARANESAAPANRPPPFPQPLGNAVLARARLDPQLCATSARAIIRGETPSRRAAPRRLTAPKSASPRSASKLPIQPPRPAEPFPLSAGPCHAETRSRADPFTLEPQRRREWCASAPQPAWCRPPTPR